MTPLGLTEVMYLAYSSGVLYIGNGKVLCLFNGESRSGSASEVFTVGQADPKQEIIIS